MNTDKIIAESIAKDYAPKESSKIVALKKLDKKAKLPATIFNAAVAILFAPFLATAIREGLKKNHLSLTGGFLSFPVNLCVIDIISKKTTIS